MTTSKPKDNSLSFRPNKKLGQHFLRDATYLDKIISSLHIQKEDTILEIGPGAGVLTEKLIPLCKKIYAIEIDRSLVEQLKNKFGDYKHVEIIHRDILQADFKEIAKGNILRVVGNLPYNISSQIVFKIIEEQAVVHDAVLMFQKELAEKFTGVVGTKKYGPITIFTQQFFEVAHLFDVPKSAFYPVPEIVSSVLSFIKRKNPLIIPQDQQGFERFVKIAFTHRRKKLLNNIRNYSTKDIGALTKLFEKFNISIHVRAEDVPIAEFNVLYEAINNDVTT